MACSINLDRPGVSAGSILPLREVRAEETISMGMQKRLLEENKVCPDCGADMISNEDGELECGSYNFCESEIRVLMAIGECPSQA